MLAEVGDVQDDPWVCEHRDSNALDDLPPKQDSATISEMTDPTSLGRSFVDVRRHTPVIPPERFFQGAAAPTGQVESTTIYPVQDSDCQAANRQLHPQPGADTSTTRYLQAPWPVPPQLDLLNCTDPTVMQIVEAVRSQMQAGHQQVPAAAHIQQPAARAATDPMPHYAANLSGGTGLAGSGLRDRPTVSFHDMRMPANMPPVRARAMYNLPSCLPPIYVQASTCSEY